MKKTAILLIAAILWPFVMQAQEVEPEELLTEDNIEVPAEKPKADNQIFTHLALGMAFLNPSTIIVPTVATTITPYVQLRAGFDWFGSPLGGMFPLSVSRFKGSPIDVGSVTLQDVTYDFQLDGNLNMSDLKLLFDFFPGARTGFHFTAGFFWDVLAGGNFIEVYTAKPVLADPADWQNVGITIRNSQYRIATDDKGMLKLNISTNPFRPYLGIGFGRAIRPDQRVRFTFDMGAFYLGGFKISTDAQTKTSLGNWDKTNLETIYLTSEDTAGFDSENPNKHMDEIDVSGVPVVNSLFPTGKIRVLDELDKINWIPYIQFSLYIRIF